METIIIIIIEHGNVNRALAITAMGNFEDSKLHLRISQATPKIDVFR